MTPQDMFEGVHFALGVGNKLRITGEAGGSVRLTVVEHGTTKLLDVTPDVALKLADVLRTIAICAKHAKDDQT